MLRLEVSIHIGMTEGCMWCAWYRIGSAMGFSPFAQTQIVEHTCMDWALHFHAPHQCKICLLLYLSSHLVDGHACSCLASDKAANTLPARIIKK